MDGDGYRRYPARAAAQASCGHGDERGVCAHCISGACCSSEGPIALTPFDVLRLAAFFDLSPGDFLLAFTQDRFGDADGPAGGGGVPEAGGAHDDRFRAWVEAPESSVVTFLRRRANFAWSPCVFLKYAVDPDGTPRRVCSVHDARPLACREYYYDTCKKRWTGELAAAQAHGLELVRDGRIGDADVAAHRRRLGRAAAGEPVARAWERAFWCEMRRALHPERANEEGAAGFALEAFQDPLDEKLNRLLSRRNLRFEEKYGPRAVGEQLHPYSSGLRFKDSADRARLLRIVRAAPGPDPFFADEDYPYLVGLRTLPPGLPLCEEAAPSFAAPPAPAAGDGGATAVGEAAVRGWAFLLALASHAGHVEALTETESPGALELALLEALGPFDAAIQRRLTGTQFLEPARRSAAAAVAALLQEYAAAMAGCADPRRWMALYAPVAGLDGPGTPDPLRRIVRLVRLQTLRGLPPDWHRRRVARWLPARFRPGAPAAWPGLAQRISRLRACEPLMSGDESAHVCSAALDVLESIGATEAPPSFAAEALAALAPPGRPLPGRLRPRARRLAVRWASDLETAGGLAGPTGRSFLLRWPAMCGRLGIAAHSTPGFARAVEYVLSAQCGDGGWGADLSPAELPDWQAGYLLNVLQSTSVATESLCVAVRAGARSRRGGKNGARARTSG